MDIEARANAAKRLMDDPMLIEALSSIRGSAIKAWEGSKVDDTREREVAWLTVKVVARIEAELQSMVDNGVIAAHRVQAPLR